MIGTEVIVEGGNILDVYEGLDFSFNYSVSDIRQPDTRQTEFTKTIKLPATANNNTLFGNLFEADIANPFDPNNPNIGVNFNPNKKASVQVLQNSLPVLDGSMQLRKITVTKGRVEYEAVFIGRLIDIFGAWGDRKMNEVDETGVNIIDISDYDHALTDTVQAASWSATVGEGYVYPLIDYGRNFLIDSFGRRTYPIIDLRPAMYLKTLWNKIFEYAGATYSGSIVEEIQSDSFDFDRLVIPWTGGFSLSDQDIEDRTVFAERVTDKNLFPSALEVFDLNSSPLNPFGQYDITADEFTLQFASTYVFEGQISATVTRAMAGISTGFVPIYVDIYLNGVFYANIGYCPVDLPSSSLPIGSSSSSICPFASAEFTFAAGDIIQLKYSIDSVQFIIISNEFTSTLNAGSFAQCRPVNEELAFGDIVRMNLGLPDVTIKDFFLSVLKMFNMYMLPDKSIANHYIFYTRDEFYRTGQLRDWTYKMDRSKAIDITPMGLLSAREYEYTYSEDGDYYNDRYQGNYGRAYGSRRLDVDNDFVPERKVTEIIFSPTPLANDGTSARIVPKIYDADISEGRKPTDANIRILYYGGLLDGVVTWRHGLSGTYYSDYPYAGHWDNPITPALDINFGLSLEYYYAANGATGTLQMTNNNLFKAYHERQFLELSNKDSKLVTAMFNLTALDIHQLDFRDTILIDQTYYRLNRVIDYNPFKTGLTKVELFKAGDIAWSQPESEVLGSGVAFSNGKLAEPAPTTQGKTLNNGNQFEPFQGTVIGTGNVVSPNATGFIVQGDNNTVGASQNVTLIGSNNVVANGVTNAVAIGVNGVTITESNSHVIGDCLCFKTADITLTAAQVATLGSSRVSFGLTVPSGYYPDLISASATMGAGSTGYTGTVAALTLAIWSAGADTYQYRIGTGWIAQNAEVTTNSITFQPAGSMENQVVAGADLQLGTGDNSDPSGGDRGMKVRIVYALIAM